MLWYIHYRQGFGWKTRIFIPISLLISSRLWDDSHFQTSITTGSRTLKDAWNPLHPLLWGKTKNALWFYKSKIELIWRKTFYKLLTVQRCGPELKKTKRWYSGRLEWMLGIYSHNLSGQIPLFKSWKAKCYESQEHLAENRFSNLCSAREGEEANYTVVFSNTEVSSGKGKLCWR